MKERPVTGSACKPEGMQRGAAGLTASKAVRNHAESPVPSAIALFAKAPMPGKVKTRLVPALTPEQAAEFHAACVADTWEQLLDAPAEPFLFCHRAWEPYRELAGSNGFRLQNSGDLGERMRGCFERLCSEGFDRVLIVGADSPALPKGRFAELLALVQKENDAVLGPAEDGGYYAIGCRRPSPAMFAGVEWSTGRTFEQTRQALRAAGYRVHSGPGWWDVDTPADLERLLKLDDLGPALTAWRRRTMLGTGRNRSNGPK